MAQPAKADRADRRATVASAVSIFSLKAIVTSIGGALLTVAIWFLQTTYSDHQESQRRRSDHGAEFQARLLGLTGRLQDEMANVEDLVRQDRLREAAAHRDNQLAAALQQWETNVLLLRNQGALLYGQTVASLIFNSEEDERYAIDHCGIIVPVTEHPHEARECAARLEAEGRLLDAMVLAGPDDPARAPAARPRSFAFQADAALQVLRRSIECFSETEADRAGDADCQNMDALIRIMVNRVKLLAKTQQNIADAIMVSAGQ